MMVIGMCVPSMVVIIVSSHSMCDMVVVRTARERRHRGRVKQQERNPYRAEGFHERR
jgi:hypothetical protein